MTETRKIGIVTLVGLPAAGKTFFAKQFMKFLTKKDEFSCLHVCYDDLVSRKRQAEMAKQELAEENKAWKEARKHIADAVRDTLRLPVELDGEAADFAAKLKAQTPEPSKPLVVLVDDNNYYRSMRYAYHQLARDCGAGFCQLHLLASQAEAAAANDARQEDERVPASVIKAMEAKLEAPDPLTNSWEQFSLALKVVGVERLDATFEMCQALVQAAMDCPVQPLDDK